LSYVSNEYFFVNLLFNLNVIQSAAQLLDPAGSRQVSVQVILANLSKAIPPNTVPLLEHHEVRTLFHEMGHCLHFLLSTSSFIALSSGEVARDIVELPSQLQENFIWHPAVLTQLGRHYETGARIPPELIANLVRSRVANVAMLTLRQITLALFDQQMHSRSVGNAQSETQGDLHDLHSHTVGDLAHLHEELMRTYWKMPPTEGTNMAASFLHLVEHYDARVYSYLYSLKAHRFCSTLYSLQHMADVFAFVEFRILFPCMICTCFLQLERSLQR